MSKTQARYVDDIKRFPVDSIARRVTSPGPKWCAPHETPEGALQRIFGNDGPMLWHQARNATTKHLFSLCDEAQLRAYARFLGHHGFKPMAVRHGYLRLVLGMPLKHHHVKALAHLGITLPPGDGPQLRYQKLKANLGVTKPRAQLLTAQLLE